MNSITKKLSLVAVAALLLTGCAAGTPETEESDEGSARGGTLTLGQLGDLPSWDTSQAHVGHQLVPVSAGLRHPHPPRAGRRAQPDARH